jgi:hypothetical protein
MPHLGVDLSAMRSKNRRMSHAGIPVSVRKNIDRLHLCSDGRLSCIDVYELSLPNSNCLSYTQVDGSVTRILPELRKN